MRMKVGAAALIVASGCGGADSTVLGDGLGASPVTDLAPGAVPGAPDGFVFTPFEAYRERAEVEMGGKRVYRVEWDLFFETEEQLLEHYLSEVALISQRAGQDKSVAMTDENDDFLQYERGPEALEITYCIKASQFANLSQLEDDLAEAAHAWERAANVRFFYDRSNNGTCNDAETAGVDFVVHDTSSASAFGCSTLISEELGCHGTLDIDYSVWPWPWFDQGGNPVPITDEHPNLTLVGILRHELGHVLGLRHEHAFDPDGAAAGCNEPQIVTCAVGDCALGGEPLTEYDVESVMHYPFCDGDAGTAFELTNLDGVGIRYLYGMPVAWNQPLINLL